MPTSNDAAAFYEAVGRAIAAWAHVDEALFQVFVQSMNGPYRQCSIIYYKSPGLDPRLSMVDEIVRSILPATLPGKPKHETVKSWSDIKGEMLDLLPVRRRIAHHSVQHRSIGAAAGLGSVSSTPPTETGLATTGFMVTAGFSVYMGLPERARGRSIDQQGLGIEELRRHQDEVVRLAGRLVHFAVSTLPPFVAQISPRPE
jgi:hypothetical protein